MDDLSQRAGFPTILILTVALLLGVAGASGLVLEIRPFLAASNDPAVNFAALVNGPPAAGLSIRSQEAALLRCHRTVISTLSLAQSTWRREPVVKNCLTLADEISSRNSTFSFALFVGALASHQLGDRDGLVQRLGESQRVGATELWIAELRVDLAESARERFGTAGLEFEDEDLALLAMSNRGVRSIAYRYVDQPEFRERITIIVEQMSASEQRRFLAAVAGAAAEIGP